MHDRRNSREKNPTSATAPIFGFTPSNMLVPPTMSGIAESVTAVSAAGTPVEAV
ncbi:MAG TPA: hypothetical protein VMB66_04560 [Candidatus Acidoferrales bacterium]|nr:hypothetical protein [Candidatus Acidoferrales bacterium]